MRDLIERLAAIDAVLEDVSDKRTHEFNAGAIRAVNRIKSLPSAQPKIIRCRECKHWKQQTNYAGAPLSFGFCESDDMWRSLYGETCEVSHIDTDDDFYCGFAERRTDG